MGYRVGVIPAAGTGSRWGGYTKELLPCGEGRWLLDRTLDAMQQGGAEAALIVTNERKASPLADHLTDAPLPVFFAVQRHPGDIYGAMAESFPFPADDFLFAMPDTVFPVDTFQQAGKGGFGIGIFETTTPERFGVLEGGRVVNKQPLGPGLYDAWGVLRWDRRVVDYWQRVTPADYTDALNLAIGRFRLHTWRLDYYYDMATWADYEAFVREGADGC